MFIFKAGGIDPGTLFCVDTFISILSGERETADSIGFGPLLLRRRRRKTLKVVVLQWECRAANDSSWVRLAIAHFNLIVRWHSCCRREGSN